MPTESPASLAGFVDALDSTAATMLLLNRTRPEPFVRLLERAFGTQPVHVVERDVPGDVADLLVLLRDGDVVATSSLDALAESLLLVNADRYRSRLGDLDETVVPAVVRELADIEFELRGYPASSKEKLLLVALSRFIEVAAIRAGAGEVHAGFGRLSRLDDERGTRAVYERLADSAVRTHVYGAGEGPADCPAGLVVHAGTAPEYRTAWFVVFVPPEGTEGHAALVASETGDNVWRGTWTFDPGTVRDVREYVAAEL